MITMLLLLFFFFFFLIYFLSLGLLNSYRWYLMRRLSEFVTPHGRDYRQLTLSNWGCKVSWRIDPLVLSGSNPICFIYLTILLSLKALVICYSVSFPLMRPVYSCFVEFGLQGFRLSPDDYTI